MPTAHLVCRPGIRSDSVDLALKARTPELSRKALGAKANDFWNLHYGLVQERENMEETKTSALVRNGDSETAVRTPKVSILGRPKTVRFADADSDRDCEITDVILIPADQSEAMCRAEEEAIKAERCRLAQERRQWAHEVWGSCLCPVVVFVSERLDSCKSV